MTLTVGQNVRMYPHGDPGQAATGVVRVVTSDQRSIAVAFDHRPPFAYQKAAGVFPEYGIILIASRYEFGPWIEMAGGGHYEIEEISPHII